MDQIGNQLFSGNRSNVNGASFLEWGPDPATFLSGQDVISMAMTFGETSFYYNATNPVTGNWQRKVGFVKRVTTYGVSILAGSGIYLD